MRSQYNKRYILKSGLLVIVGLFFALGCGDWDNEKPQGIKASSLTESMDITGTILGAEFTPNIGYLTFTDNERFTNSYDPYKALNVNLVLKQDKSKASVSCGDTDIKEVDAADTSDKAARTFTITKVSYDRVWWQRYVRRIFGPNWYVFTDVDTNGKNVGKGEWDYYDELGGFTDIMFGGVDPVNHIIEGTFYSESSLDKDGNEFPDADGDGNPDTESVSGTFAVPYCDFSTTH